MKTVEDRITERMAQLGWTGRQLARETGESESSVQRWLKDGGAPTRFLLECQEAGLGRAAWLLTGEGSPDTSEEEARAILEEIRALVAPRVAGEPRWPGAGDAEAVDEAAEMDAEGPRPGPGRRHHGAV